MPKLYIFDDVSEAIAFEVYTSGNCKVIPENDDSVETTESDETPTSVAETATEVESTVDETPKKKRRGRPKKTETVEEEPAAPKLADLPTEAHDEAQDEAQDAITIEELRSTCIAASDTLGPGRVSAILMKFTGGVSSKAKDVPEDLRVDVLAEINSALEEAVA